MYFLMHENGCRGKRDSMERIGGRIWILDRKVGMGLMDG